MSQEIVFTSAKRGLRAGSTGFCTVRSTSGLAQNLATLLEQLTGYNHAVDPYDRALTEQHPVNFAHYLARLGGQRIHLLGRVSNAPLDHTNRSNKLAHLIGFDEDEISLSATQGPAEELVALQSRHLFVESWTSDTEPSLLPDARRVKLPQAPPSLARRVSEAPGPCHTWKRIAGDARWAGVLAETARTRGTEPVPIIFAAEQSADCLALVVEALSLLAPHERWDVTFSTYYSGSLPTKVECRWQFLLETSELARKARRSSRGTVLDLPRIRAERLVPPTTELTAEAATAQRSWMQIKGKETPPPRRPPSPGGGPVTDDVPTDADRAFDAYELSGEPPGLRNRRSAARSDLSARPLLLRPMSIAAICLLITAGAAVGWFRFGRTPKSDEFDRIAQSSDARLDQTRTQPSPKRKTVDKKVDRQTEIAQTNEPEKKDKPIVPVATAKIDVPQPKPEPVKPDVEKPKGLPFDNIREQGTQLALDLPVKGLGAAARTTGPMKLARIELASPADCELKLLGGESVLKGGSAFEIKDSTHGQSREWAVAIRSRGIGQASPVGRFLLTNGDLLFEWDRDNKSDYGLVNCAISLKGRNALGADHVEATLRRPESKKPIRPRFEVPIETETLLVGSTLSNTRNLVLTWKVDGLPDGHKIHGPRELRVGEEIVVETIRQFDNQPLAMFDIKLSLQTKTGDVVLLTSLVMHIPFFERDPPRILFKPKEYKESDFAKLDELREKWTGELLLAEDQVEKEIKRCEELKVDSKGKPKQVEKAEKQLAKAHKDRDQVTNVRRFVNQYAGWLNEITTLRDELKQSLVIRYELKLETEFAKTVPLVATSLIEAK